MGTSFEDEKAKIKRVIEAESNKMSNMTRSDRKLGVSCSRQKAGYMFQSICPGTCGFFLQTRICLYSITWILGSTAIAPERRVQLALAVNHIRLIASASVRNRL